MVLSHFILIENKLIDNTFTITTFAFFASPIKKSIVVFPAPSKFAVKFICWIALGSASRTYCIKLLQLFYKFLWNGDNLTNN